MSKKGGRKKIKTQIGDVIRGAKEAQSVGKSESEIFQYVIQSIEHILTNKQNTVLGSDLGSDIINESMENLFKTNIDIPSRANQTIDTIDLQVFDPDASPLKMKDLQEKLK